MIVCVFGLAATACGPAETETDPEPVACGEQTATGNACSFDGECSEYFVCIDGSCSVPETMTGDNPAGTLEIEGTTFSYELAAGDFARERGLAGRPCMADGWGLLLEWPESGGHQIGMTGMLFDLDLIFLDEFNQVVDVIRGAPAGSKALYGAGEVRRVLEVEAGAAP